MNTNNTERGGEVDGWEYVEELPGWKGRFRFREGHRGPEWETFAESRERWERMRVPYPMSLARLLLMERTAARDREKQLLHFIKRQSEILRDVLPILTDEWGEDFDPYSTQQEIRMALKDCEALHGTEGVRDAV